jgi:hypothetical protein
MFKVAGVSRHEGQVKVRFANDMTRVKILVKNGHTDIELVELPTEMEKGDAVKHLLTTELVQNSEYKAAIDSADAKYNPVVKVKAPKADKPVKVKAPKAEKTAPTIESIAAKAKKAKAKVEETAADAEKTETAE